MFLKILREIVREMKLRHWEKEDFVWLREVSWTGKRSTQKSILRTGAGKVNVESLVTSEAVQLILTWRSVLGAEGQRWSEWPVSNRSVRYHHSPGCWSSYSWNTGPAPLRSTLLIYWVFPSHGSNFSLIFSVAVVLFYNYIHFLSSTVERVPLK